MYKILLHLNKNYNPFLKKIKFKKSPIKVKMNAPPTFESFLLFDGEKK